MVSIKGKFDWKIQEVVTAFVQGHDAKTIYNLTKGIRTDNISYNEKDKIIKGSTPFLSAKIDTLVMPLGLHVANLRDLSRPEVMEMVKDKHYSDSPSLVLRSMDDINSRNIPLIKRIAEEVERVNGSLKLPVMVTGFNVAPVENDRVGYDITIVPRVDFTALHDERFDKKYHETTFSEVDDL